MRPRRSSMCSRTVEPPNGASAFPGKRVEPMRAWTIAATDSAVITREHGPFQRRVLGDVDSGAPAVRIHEEPRRHSSARTLHVEQLRNESRAARGVDAGDNAAARAHARRLLYREHLLQRRPDEYAQPLEIRDESCQ